MIVEQIQFTKKRAVATGLGVKRKVSTLMTKRSPVSKSCQIDNLRQIYIDLGLQSNVGTFVEIGGYDGESFSNTSFLADQNWRGIYVEPVPDFCAQIRSRHWLNQVIVEPVAIGATTGRSTIHLMNALSTLNDDAKAAYQKMPWSKKTAAKSREIEIEVDTLAAVLSRNDIVHDFELMIIDVEGNEETIVDALLESNWRPKVLIVELQDRCSHFSEFTDMKDADQRTRNNILKSGYKEYYADEVNSIFSLTN